LIFGYATAAIMLVSDQMILKHPKDAIPEFFVEWSGLETEDVEEPPRFQR
jgi:hypothetical protein